MMISPETFVEMHKEITYEELLSVRDKLIEDIKAFEKKWTRQDDYMILPSPSDIYQMNLEYLSALCSLIRKKYRFMMAGEDYEDLEEDNDETSEDLAISIQKIGITKLDTDAIVNAANDGLWEGSGVCGAIFREAGSAELTKACQAIGGCKTGSAVITPGFNLKAKYIIHAVGPVWKDGNHHEPQDLYGCYTKSLELCKENNLHTIGFPLISAGIFGYPRDKAWRKALQACKDFISKNPDYDIQITFAVLDDNIKKLGEEILIELLQE